MDQLQGALAANKTQLDSALKQNQSLIDQMSDLNARLAKLTDEKVELTKRVEEAERLLAEEKEARAKLAEANAAQQQQGREGTKGSIAQLRQEIKSRDAMIASRDRTIEGLRQQIQSTAAQKTTSTGLKGPKTISGPPQEIYTHYW